MIKAALIDMDGVLYDSMKYHTLAWKEMMAEIGIETSRDEFYLYEGMTGRDTINLIYRKLYGRDCDPQEASRLYARKAQLFVEMGRKEVMEGAPQMIARLQEAGVKCVLVTGSAQSSLISRLDEDYPGVFPADRRVTALDVTHGKPSAEPYLAGLAKGGVKAEETIVIENAPLGVKAGKAAGLFTIAVTTGPIPREAFEEAGADLIYPSMEAFAKDLPRLLMIRKNEL